jgi:predicted transcriptional regulator
MRAVDVMVREVLTVKPDTDVAEAIKLLAEHDVSALPVVDDDDAVVGIISEADMVHWRGRRVAPIRPHHSWDCYRTVSNAVHYNLPRHSDHHMFATKAFWQLDAQPSAPTLPFGYQTMAVVALTPLWRHMMRRLLADWDQRFASEAERELVRARNWQGLA